MNPPPPRLPIFAFFAANAISLIGNSLTIIAVPWFVLETTGSPARMGLVGFFTALPAVIAAFFGGTLVDRVGHRRMSIVADLASGFTVALIPLFHTTVGLQFWVLLVIVFFSALLDAPGNTARQALLPDVARRSGMSLELANSLQQTVQRASIFIGPALAGLLIAGLGASQVLWIDAATFALSALLFILAVPAGSAQPLDTTGYLPQLLEGLRFLRRDRLIRSLVLTVAVTNFLDSPLFAVIFPVYAKEIFSSASQLGFMLSAFGAGAVVGALSYGFLGKRLSRRSIFVGAFIIVGLGLVVLALRPPFIVVLIANFIAGLAAGPINPLLMTVFQERIPPNLRGRVFGMATAIALIAAPLGMVAAGFLVERFSVGATLLGIAVIYLLVTLYGLFNPALRELNNPFEKGEAGT